MSVKTTASVAGCRIHHGGVAEFLSHPDKVWYEKVRRTVMKRTLGCGSTLFQICVRGRTAPTTPN
jgi:hypothetical protein